MRCFGNSRHRPAPDDSRHANGGKLCITCYCRTQLEKAQAFQNLRLLKRYMVVTRTCSQTLDIEAVYIFLPNHLHGEWTICACSQESTCSAKTLAVSELSEARHLFETAEKNDVLPKEAFAYLCSPIITAIKTELDNSAIGDICYMDSAFITGRPLDTNIRMRRETRGGAFYDLGCYPLSLALYLIGREPEKVTATALFSDRKIDLFTSSVLFTLKTVLLSASTVAWYCLRGVWIVSVSAEPAAKSCPRCGSIKPAIFPIPFRPKNVRKRMCLRAKQLLSGGRTAGQMHP